jgi:hypothetical protein
MIASTAGPSLIDPLPAVCGSARGNPGFKFEPVIVFLLRTILPVI